MALIDEARALFGMGVTLTEAKTFAAPSSGVGHGLQREESIDRIAPAKVKGILVQPSFEPDPELAAALGLSTVSRWDGDRCIVALGDIEVAIAKGAAEHLHEIGWVVDTRTQLGGLAIAHREGPLPTVYWSSGVIGVGELVIARAVDLPIVLSGAPAFDLPAIAALLDSLEVATWLRDEVRKRASAHSPIERVAAVGLASRLALGELSTPARMFAAITGGAPDPLDVLDAWARGLPDPVIAFFETLVIDEAVALASELELLVPDDTAEIARSLCVRRDDLESVMHVIAMVRPASPAREALHALDLQASAKLDVLDHLAPALEPLFDAVAAAEPDAWWSTCSR